MTLLDYIRKRVGQRVPITYADREAEINRRINDMSNIELIAWVGDYMNLNEK